MSKLKKVGLIFLLLLLLLGISTVSYSKQHFKIIFEHLMIIEGEKTVQAEDGYSKFGLTKYYVENPQNLTRVQAYEIIHQEIYKKYNLHKIKRLSVKHLCLDYIFNTNPYKAVREIKKLCKRYNPNINPKSMKIDEGTLKVLNSNPYIYNDILVNRMNYIRSLKKYKKYGKGWEKRLDFFKKEYEYEFF